MAEHRLFETSNFFLCECGFAKRRFELSNHIFLFFYRYPTGSILHCERARRRAVLKLKMMRKKKKRKMRVSHRIIDLRRVQ